MEENKRVELKISPLSSNMKPLPLRVSWTKMTEFLMNDFSIDFEEITHEVRTSIFLHSMNIISNNYEKRLKKFRKQMGLD